jgi:PAS domain S-box-containing protein
MSEGDWEGDIVRGLEDLGDAAGASRIYIFDIAMGADGEAHCSQRYEWVAPGIAPQIANPGLQQFPLRAGGYGRWADVLSAGGAIRGDIASFPESEQSVLEAQGIVSLLIVPIFAGGDWWGFMGFDECRRSRTWSASEVEALRTAAGILGGAIRHQRTSAALRESERRYRRLVEQSPDATLVRRGERILFANSATRRLLGLKPPERVTGRSIFEFVHPADMDEVRRRIGEPLSLMGTPRLELRVLSRSGQCTTVEATADDIDWAGERASQVVLRDITDRRQAEQSARELIREQAARAAAEEAERRARFLDEASSVLSASLDYHTTLRSVARMALTAFADSCVVYVIEAGGRLNRVEVANVDPVKEATLRELLIQDPPHPSSARSTIATVMRTGVPALIAETTEDWLRSGARDEVHLERCRSVMSSSLVCVPLLVRGEVSGAISFGRASAAYPYVPADLVLARELASRAALAIDNARLYQEARDASHAKSEFMAVMSHELKTPLTAIATYADLLREGSLGPISAAQRQPLDVIVSNSMHLAELIDEVVAFTRTASERMEAAADRIAVAELAAELIEWVRPTASARGLRLTLGPLEKGVLVETDATRLRQIIVNLLTNAVRFTEEGGVEISVTRERNRVWIHVSDTGIGISPDHLTSIFEPFWQVDPEDAATRTRGSGLGLSIVQRLCARLGGGVTVESELGRGSRFSVWIPAAGPAAER